MSNKAKAILNLIVNCLASAAGAAMAAIQTADGVDAFKRPFVWLGIIVAVGPVIRAAIGESPASGADLDKLNGRR
jgi:hypothetical protein